jgi:hypothetical protein
MKEIKGLAETSPGLSRLVEEDSWCKSYSMLAAFLFDVTFDSGKPRETCSMSVGSQDGLVRAFLNDKNTSLSASLAAKTPTALFKAISDALDKESLTWTLGYSSAKKTSRKR